jgi:LacI family transcriptional regulator
MGRMGSSRIRIKDLANALGISVGTVDRALKNRPEVSAATKEKVLKLARESGYRPDPVASVLSTQRRLRVAVILPRGVTPFHREVKAGIEEEHIGLGESIIELEFFTFLRLGSGESEALRRATDKRLDGLIISSAAGSEIRAAIQFLLEQHIPVICVGTEFPSLKTVANVTVDPFSSGGLAGDLIGNYSQQDGPIAVVTGDLSVTNHREKVEAFQSTIKRFFPSHTLLPVIEAHDDRGEAHSRSLQLFRSYKDLSACYVTTGNSIPVLKALTETIPGTPLVVTTDIFPELLPFLREGTVFGTLYQQPRSQGALAYRALYRQLNGLPASPQSIRLDPYLITRASLDSFFARHRELLDTR